MKRTTFEVLLPVARRNGEPLRTQLVRELRSAIQCGRLAPGTALPSSRRFANDLGLSRGIVVEAYEQLVAEGYLVARRGSATRVGARTPPTDVRCKPPGAAHVPRPRFDFRPGVPDLSLFPKRAWLRAFRRVFDADPALDYPDPQGVAAAREALATYLNRSRATVADASRVMLCTGFAQAARLVSEVLYARGVRRLAVEDPGHAEQCADMRSAGLELVPIPVDGNGIRVDLLRGLDVGGVLVTPAHQYPTGAVLDSERRAALLAWAARRNAFILEDDYDAEYRYDREPIGALQGLAPDRVVYFGSASKMLVPSLRQGWLVVPNELVADISRAKLAADRGSPSLEQLALAAFIEAGELDRHLRRTRAIYRRRRNALVSALSEHLPELNILGVAAGLHLLVELPRGTNEAELVSAAAKRRIRIYGAAAYHADPDSAPPAIVIGYGGLPEEEIERGVKRLAEVVAKCGP